MLQQMGKIGRVAVTNFDVPHLAEIVDAGVNVATHQLQYSLVDARPELQMVDYCRSRGIALLCYGTVAGGWISERWLNQPEPVEPFANRSLVKYRLIIEEFGGWQRFQSLLSALQRIATKHSTDIASVATRAILDRPGVAAAIVGATNTAHPCPHTRKSEGWIPTPMIGPFLPASSSPATVHPVATSTHSNATAPGNMAGIMKYNLTKAE